MQVLAEHIKRVAGLYPRIKPGTNLTAARSDAEIELLDEMSSARVDIREAVKSLGRSRPIVVKVGFPKPSWAHVYYVSFHDPIKSTSPQRGYYPVLLLSIDQRQCWLTVATAAAPAGISGRGGWTKPRGRALRDTAQFLGRHVVERDGWTKGSISLGQLGESLAARAGSDYSAGRGYECGAIISKKFDPNNPPDLGEWLQSAFVYFDQIRSSEEMYIFDSSGIPRVEDGETAEQIDAAITGKKAEEHFKSWAPAEHPEWGPLEDKTSVTGVGFDFLASKVDLRFEVKGCREDLSSIRLTEGEWERAEKYGDRYVLAIVLHVDEPKDTKVLLIPNPYKLFSKIDPVKRLQITYVISAAQIRRKI